MSEFVPKGLSDGTVTLESKETERTIVSEYLARRVPTLFDERELPNSVRNWVRQAQHFKLFPDAGRSVVQFWSDSETAPHGTVHIVEYSPWSSSVIFQLESPASNKLMLRWASSSGYQDSSIMLDQFSMQVFNGVTQPERGPNSPGLYLNPGRATLLRGDMPELKFDSHKVTKYTVSPESGDPDLSGIYDFKGYKNGICRVDYAHEGGTRSRILVPNAIQLAR